MKMPNLASVNQVGVGRRLIDSQFRPVSGLLSGRATARRQGEGRSGTGLEEVAYLAIARVRYLDDGAGSAATSRPPQASKATSNACLVATGSRFRLASSMGR